MRYVSQHQTGPSRTGVLLTNLGTPDAPERGALRRYLKEFLGDPRVVEFPRALWWLVLNLIILNVRPSRSAKAYKTVWTERGSPLLFHTQDLGKAIAERLHARHGDQVILEVGMRYGSPSIASGIEALLAKGATKVLVLPLFPQYSGATGGSTWDAVAQDLERRRTLPDVRFIGHYHDDPGYIAALADSIARYQAEHGKPDKLLFSYHGIPKRYCTQGDPYEQQCKATTALVAQQLGLDEADYMLVFQSRFGREEWLNPYTDETLKSLPAKGVQSVQVICPGFSADCLETIEEIGEENREYFLEAGGKRYEYIPCLNSEDAHAEALCDLLERNLSGWLP